jgi:hypothetical protein
LMGFDHAVDIPPHQGCPTTTSPYRVQK